MAESIKHPVDQLRRTPRRLRGVVPPTWADRSAVNCAFERRLRRRTKRAKLAG